MTFKILHSADWQLGMRFSFLAERSVHLESARFEALRNTLTLARSHTVDAIVAAGDLFENSQVASEIILQAAEILASAPCPVYLLPGNHDPLGDYSVYHHSCWRNHPTVKIFSSDAPIETDRAIFVPAPCLASFSAGDPTQAWRARWRNDRFFIGVAHGSLENQGFPVAIDDFPISPDLVERVNYDYIALGHWHSSYFLSRHQQVKLAYSGTPEATGFGERESGQVLIVEIEQPGGPAQITAHPTGSFVWREKSATLCDANDLALLQSELEEIADLENSLLSLNLTGNLDAPSANRLGELLAVLETRVFFLRVDNAISQRSDNFENLDPRIPDGLCRAVGERLLMKLRADSSDKPVVERALVRLLEICERLESES